MSFYTFWLIGFAISMAIIMSNIRILMEVEDEDILELKQSVPNQIGLVAIVFVIWPILFLKNIISP